MKTTVQRLWTLLRRELAASRSLLLIIAGLMVIWNLLLATRIGMWPTYLAESMAMWPMFIVLPWAAIASVQSWHREWGQGSIHYTLAFPVPGWALVATKATAAVIETAFLGLTAAIVGWPLYGRMVHGPADALGQSVQLRAMGITAFKAGVMLAVVLFVLSIIVQLGYLAARAARLPAGLISPLTVVAASWALIRCGGLLNKGLAWLPSVTFWAVGRAGKAYQLQARPAGIAPVVSAAIVGLGYLAVTAWLAERHLDV